jgi:acyl carrier protein
MNQKIAEFLKSAQPSSSASVSDILSSQDLFADGYLDSILNLKLLAYVEKEAGMRIPPLQVTRKSFQNIPSIVALIDRIRDGG